MDKMISIGEVAELLGVSEDNIALWASQNGIPTYYEADHLRRFKRPAIDKWLKRAVLQRQPIRSRAKRSMKRSRSVRARA